MRYGGNGYMTPSEKRRATIIDKYGSWEAYVEQRYLNPEHAESRRERPIS